MHAYVVTSLAGDAEAAERLKQTALRDFGPPADAGDQEGGPGYIRITK